MDKGIRNAARHLFVEMNEQRRRGEFGVTKKADTVFRLGLCAKLADDFGISMASAGAAYQEAFKFVRNLNSELVDGLGRAPDKNNGGRKKKVKEEVAEIDLYEAALAAVAGSIPNVDNVDQVPSAAALTAKEVEGVVDELTPDLGEMQTLFAVKRSKDGEVVAEGVDYDTARSMVEKAKKAKQAKLYWI